MPKFALTPEEDKRLREALRQPGTSDRGREFIKILRSLAEDGATYRTVANRLSISQLKIRSAVRVYQSAGIAGLTKMEHRVGRPGYAQEVRARVIELAGQTAPALSIKAIAERAGVSVGVAHGWIAPLRRTDPRTRS